jgi:hypothetical protein
MLADDTTGGQDLSEALDYLCLHLPDSTLKAAFKRGKLMPTKYMPLESLRLVQLPLRVSYLY